MISSVQGFLIFSGKDRTNVHINTHTNRKQNDTSSFLSAFELFVPRSSFDKAVETSWLIDLHFCSCLLVTGLAVFALDLRFLEELRIDFPLSVLCFFWLSSLFDFGFHFLCSSVATLIARTRVLPGETFLRTRHHYFLSNQTRGKNESKHDFKLKANSFLKTQMPKT